MAQAGTWAVSPELGSTTTFYGVVGSQALRAYRIHNDGPGTVQLLNGNGQVIATLGTGQSADVDETKLTVSAKVANDSASGWYDNL